MSDSAFLPYKPLQLNSENEMKNNSLDFLNKIGFRKSIRHFSDKPVPLSIIKNCIKAAGTAPSGANLQPWQFVVVSDSKVKKEIRIAAEKEEESFYHDSAPDEWLEVLKPLGTNEVKSFLVDAPYLIAIFMKKYTVDSQNRISKHYYVHESVGIATGILITALHFSGLVTLTHTPSPMKFLNKILERPKNEKPYLLLVVGHPADKALIPNITKKKFDEICTIF
jgi:nitroreductase